MLGLSDRSELVARHLWLDDEMRSSSFEDYLDSHFVVHGLFVDAFGGKGVVDIREGSLRPNTKAREYPC